MFCLTFLLLSFAYFICVTKLRLFLERLENKQQNKLRKMVDKTNLCLFTLSNNNNKEVLGKISFITGQASHTISPIKKNVNLYWVFFVGDYRGKLDFFVQTSKTNFDKPFSVNRLNVYKLCLLLFLFKNKKSKLCLQIIFVNLECEAVLCPSFALQN